jgi:hypothetical protein
MRDFEVIFDNEKEIQIARNQGIGIIICNLNGRYIKLYNNNGKIDVAENSKWEHSSFAKQKLHGDLGLGYDLFYIKTNGETQRFCEEHDKRDEKETTIILPHLIHLANYQQENTPTKDENIVDSGSNTDESQEESLDDDSKEEITKTKKRPKIVLSDIL